MHKFVAIDQVQLFSFFFLGGGGHGTHYNLSAVPNGSDQAGLSYLTAKGVKK